MTKNMCFTRYNFLLNIADYKNKLVATPAKLAAAIQLAAALISIGLYLIILKSTGIFTPLLASVIGCALIATSLSVLLKMAAWWHAINAAFPLALWVSLQFNVSPNYYLAAFLLLLLIYWNTFQSQVPFYPSSSSLWKHLIQFIPNNNPVKMIDIGSGLGDLILNMAKHRPDCEFTGIEIAPLPWLISALRALLLRSKAKFLYKSYFNMSLAPYDIVFAYLSPAAMPALWDKASVEMRNGTLLICHEFEIPNIKPDQSLKLDKTQLTTYLYLINKTITQTKVRQLSLNSQ